MRSPVISNAICGEEPVKSVHSNNSEEYLYVAWLNISEKEHDNDEEESTNKIKSTPPSTRNFDAFC